MHLGGKFKFGEKKEIYVVFFSLLGEKSIGEIFFSLSSKQPVCLFGNRVKDFQNKMMLFMLRHFFFKIASTF